MIRHNSGYYNLSWAPLVTKHKLDFFEENENKLQIQLVDTQMMTLNEENEDKMQIQLVNSQMISQLKIATLRMAGLKVKVILKC